MGRSWDKCEGAIVRNCERWYGCTHGGSSGGWCEVESDSCSGGSSSSWDYCSAGSAADQKWPKEELPSKGVRPEVIYGGVALIVFIIIFIICFRHRQKVRACLCPSRANST